MAETNEDSVSTTDTAIGGSGDEKGDTKIMNDEISRSNSSHSIDGHHHRQKEIRVLVAGLGRTGTLSMNEALKRLGYNPMHYVDPDHTQIWYDVATGQTPTSTIIDRIVEDGYDAVSDNPIADIYLDIIKMFPNVKVILTVRDTPTQFANSWKTLYESIEVTEQEFTLWYPSFFQWIPLFRHLKRIRCFMGTTHLELPECHLLKQWSEYPDGWLETQYERHNDHVRKHVSSQNLLEFNVKHHGWDELCAFLFFGEEETENGISSSNNNNKNRVPDICNEIRQAQSTAAATTTTTSLPQFPYVKVNTSQGLLELRRVFVIVTYTWIPIMMLVAVVPMKIVRFFLAKRRSDSSTKKKDE
mmetsp:Transcript_13237/g.32290  ORF Transcript_13237/g.32290 Transcript_13237/m.32290 type:complete len:357 (+) Transcript_13237:68-1138(+)